MSFSKKVIKVGLLGMGTVGRGVYRLLTENADHIESRVGAKVDIKKILVKDINKDRGISIDPNLLTTDVDDILNDKDIDIVVEVIGGTGVAVDYVRRALKNGQSVVTANKDMMALYSKELFELAASNNCNILFGASVAGAVPIIRTLRKSLASDKVQSIYGIINGTTNYILTKMTEEGADFNEMLKEAQAKGYAEADPTADVEGHDAARKIAILASVAFNTYVTLDDVYVEGITKISIDDINYVSELGYVIKLLGIAKIKDEGIEVKVHPTLIPKSHLLASVGGVFNAVLVHGSATGEMMFYGQGAGELPTATAVVADIMDIAVDILRNVPKIVGYSGFTDKPTLPISESESRFYVKILIEDRPGVLASIAMVFGNEGINLDTVIQQDAKKPSDDTTELIFITHATKEKNLQNVLCCIKDLSGVREINSVIRVEG